MIADDPTTPGEISKRQVLQTFVRETDTLIHIYIDGEVISTTEEHPFWVPDLGWVEAGDLEVGMLLQTDEETFVDIDRIEEQDGEFEVYNFKVDDFHTYFVSDLELLVHNAEYFYRTMSQKEYNRVIENNGLVIRDKGSSELGITPERNYLDDLSTRKKGKTKYEVKVKFEVNDGTLNELTDPEISGTHISAVERYPDHDAFVSGQGKIQIKLEKGETLALLLGDSPIGVGKFNNNIININTLD